MAEVRIKTDSSNMRKGIRVTTKEAQKLTKTLTKTKAPLLHPGETRKAISVNQRYNRGLRQSASGYKQIGQSARTLVTAQKSIIRSQSVMINQMQKMQALQAKMGGQGVGGGAGGGGALPAGSRGSGTGAGGQPSGPFSALHKSFKNVTGFFGKFLAPLIAPLGVMAALGSRGTGTLIQRQQSGMMLRQTTGRRFGGLGSAGVNLGYSRAQTYQLAQQQAMAMGGFSRGNTLATLQMSRARGLDPSVLMGLQSAARQTGGVRRKTTAMKINASVIRGMGMGGFARSLTSEFAQAMTGAMSTMQDRAVRSSYKNIAGLIGRSSFQMGGQFAKSPLATGRLLGRADAAVRGGTGAGNALMVAELMKGGLSYAQAQEKMQAGLFSGNNLSAFLKVSRRFGTGATGRMIAGQAFGMNSLDLKALQKIDPRSVSSMPSVLSSGLVRYDTKGRAMTTAGDIRRDAVSAANQIGIQRRQIQTAETFATMRLRMDPAYAAANSALIMVLGKVNKSLQVAIPKIVSIFDRSPTFGK